MRVGRFENRLHGRGIGSGLLRIGVCPIRSSQVPVLPYFRKNAKIANSTKPPAITSPAYSLRVIDLYTHASPIAIHATGKNRLMVTSLLPHYVAVQCTHGVIFDGWESNESRRLTLALLTCFVGAVRWPVVSGNLGPGRADRLLVATLLSRDNTPENVSEEKARHTDLNLLDG